MKKETRPIENFSKIKFKDFGTLIINQGDAPALTIEADDELMPELIAEVRGDTLVLGIDDDWFNRFGKVISSFFNSKDHQVTYHLTVVDLEKLSISGKCKLMCDSLKSEDLAIRVSGYGNLTITNLECESLDLNISGRAEFEAAGQAKKQFIKISGSGEVKAVNLASQSVRIVISGQGNAGLRVEDSLDVTISGMGLIKYHGCPKLRQVISGFGQSKRLNAE